MGRDLARDEWLLRRGVIVLRFWNSDITENISGVLEAIAANVSELKAQRTASTVRWTPTPTLPLPAGGSAPSSRHR